MVKIALDYDDTYTKAPELWDRFITDANDLGHEVKVVTARNSIADKIPDEFDCDIIYCDGIAKRFYCTWFANKTEGWVPEIWIDDKPSSIDNNSTATRDHLNKWRNER